VKLLIPILVSGIAIAVLIPSNAPRAVTSPAESSIPRREILDNKPSVKAVAAAINALNVLRASAVDVIDGQRRKVIIATAEAGFTIVREDFLANAVSVPCNVFGTMIAVSCKPLFAAFCNAFLAPSAERHSATKRSDSVIATYTAAKSKSSSNISATMLSGIAPKADKKSTVLGSFGVAKRGSDDLTSHGKIITVVQLVSLGLQCA
jgi:hypothetical protein